MGEGQDGGAPPPPPATLAGPTNPTVVPAKAGNQGRGAAQGRLRLPPTPKPPPSLPRPPSRHSHQPSRHSCEGRYPEGRGCAGIPLPVASTLRESVRPEPVEACLEGTRKRPPPCNPLSLTPTVVPPKAGTQRRAAQGNPLPPNYPRTPPNPAPRQRARGAMPPRASEQKGQRPPLTPQTAAPPAPPPRPPQERSSCSPGP